MMEEKEILCKRKIFCSIEIQGSLLAGSFLHHTAPIGLGIERATRILENQKSLARKTNVHLILNNWKCKKTYFETDISLLLTNKQTTVYQIPMIFQRGD